MHASAAGASLMASCAMVFCAAGVHWVQHAATNASGRSPSTMPVMMLLRVLMGVSLEVALGCKDARERCGGGDARDLLADRGAQARAARDGRGRLYARHVDGAGGRSRGPDVGRCGFRVALDVLVHEVRDASERCGSERPQQQAAAPWTVA